MPPPHDADSTRRESSSTRCFRSRSTRSIPTASQSGLSSRRAISSPRRSERAPRLASSGRFAKATAAISNRSPPSATGRRSVGRMRDFIDWVARWTLAPRGMALRMATRGPEGAAAPAAKFAVQPTGKPPARLTPARERVLAALAIRSPQTRAALAAAAQCGVGVVDGLIDDGALELVALDPDPAAPPLDPDFCLPAARRPTNAPRRKRWRAPSRRARRARSCSKASPARARPKSISRRSPRPCAPGGRRWCCCRRSR